MGDPHKPERINDVTFCQACSCDYAPDSPKGFNLEETTPWPCTTVKVVLPTIAPRDDKPWADWIQDHADLIPPQWLPLLAGDDWTGVRDSYGYPDR